MYNDLGNSELPVIAGLFSVDSHICTSGSPCLQQDSYVYGYLGLLRRPLIGNFLLLISGDEIVVPKF